MAIVAAERSKCRPAFSLWRVRPEAQRNALRADLLTRIWRSLGLRDRPLLRSGNLPVQSRSPQKCGHPLASRARLVNRPACAMHRRRGTCRSRWGCLMGRVFSPDWAPACAASPQRLSSSRWRGRALPEHTARGSIAFWAGDLSQRRDGPRGRRYTAPQAAGGRCPDA
jgi:hypothetical protein